eukprot:scaffold286690_cov17-Prasinocladus_malaysianus.AAC.1
MQANELNQKRVKYNRSESDYIGSIDRPRVSSLVREGRLRGGFVFRLDLAGGDGYSSGFGLIAEPYTTLQELREGVSGRCDMLCCSASYDSLFALKVFSGENGPMT